MIGTKILKESRRLYGCETRNTYATVAGADWFASSMVVTKTKFRNFILASLYDVCHLIEKYFTTQPKLIH